MSRDESGADSESMPAICRPRQQVAALVMFHLGLTCLAGYLSWRFDYLYLRDGIPNSLSRFLVAALFGFQIGQIVLLVSWGAFAGQSWILRLPRFLVLLVWMCLLSSLGESLIAGGMPAASIVEEQSAYTLFLMIAPVTTLFGYAICNRRRFTSRASTPAQFSWQFSTRRLMLITAELALLLALERIVLSHRFNITEFWNALRSVHYQIQELIPVLTSVTILPVAFVGLANRHSWHRWMATCLYLIVCSVILAWVHLSLLANSLGLNNYLYWWPELGRIVLDYLLTHFVAAATILVTFYLVRRIGYDFRWRDELPLEGGRNSSNARNSAASASA
ncbi:MAG: hypothetical protein K8R36_05995 [Planctomycetales bacterium]|nr:hypothetical protein [Planctomycetales bacterium]